MMVRSKLSPKSTSAAASAKKAIPASLSLDDFDPRNPATLGKPALKPTWARIRLAVLLSILIPLAVFGYYHNRRTTAQSKIAKALENWDNGAAIREIKALEKGTGLTAESAFLRSRAYRHLGDDIAFAQFSELARQLGYSEEKVKNERLLRDLHLGLVDDTEGALARAMAAPGAELEEIGPAVVYGLLSKLSFPEVNQFLEFWSEQNPDSPWVPFFRGMMSMAGRDTVSAIQSFESCALSHPDFVPVYGQMGAAYLKARDYEKVLPPIQRYLRSVPEDLDAYSVQAGALVNLDRGDEVIELLNPLVQTGKATVDMKTTLARVYSAREEWAKVVEILSSVASLWPEDVRTANLLSQAHQALGNEEDAARFAKIAQEGQPDLQSVDQRVSRILSGVDRTVEKHYELGHILLHKQSREEGLQWLSSALAIDATYLPAHEDLVMYFNRTNRPELAARHQRYINLRRGSQ
jgi:tetratricopeptide (TPR) repeat protein